MSAYHLNVTVHVLAALFWLGGMFFLAVVGAPVLRRVEPPELRSRLFQQIGEQFRSAGWIAILTLVVTGLLNLNFRGMLDPAVWRSPEFWQTPFGTALACKLIAVTAMLTVQAVHDFQLGPAATRVAAGTPLALKLRRRASWLARINALFGVIVVVAAVYLARSGA